MNKKNRKLLLFKYVFVAFILFSFISTTSLTSGEKITAKMDSLFNQIKAKISPGALMMLKTASKNFGKEINFSSRTQDDLALAKNKCRSFSFPGPGIDVSEAAFLVMMQATKDMDDDIRMIMAEIKAMTKAKQKLRDLIKDLNKWLSEELGSTDDSEIENEAVGASKNKQLKMKQIKVFRPVPKKYPPILKLKMKTKNYGLEYFIAPKIKTPGQLKNKPKPYLKEILGKYESDLESLRRLLEELSLKLQVMMDRRSKIIQTISIILKKISSSEDTIINNIK